jgi:hypothetical protein
MGNAPPRHHIFTLRIKQKVHPQRWLAGSRVASESNAGTRPPARIAKHHALQGHSRSNRIGYVVQAPILARLGGLPGCKDGLDRIGEL